VPAPRALPRAELLPLLLPPELVHGDNLRGFRHGQPQPAEASVPVKVVLYEIVAVGPDGRRRRDAGCNIYKTIRQAAGGYHVALRVGANELTYCAFSGVGVRVLGDLARSGVVRHDPEKPGRGFAWREEELVGNVRMSDVLRRAAEMGDDSWSRAAYSKVFHNCGNFCDALCFALGLPAGTRGWTRFVSHFQAGVSDPFGPLVQAAEAAVCTLRQGLRSAGEATAEPAQVLSEASQLLHLLDAADDSDNDDDDDDDGEGILVRALGSLHF